LKGQEDDTPVECTWTVKEMRGGRKGLHVASKGRREGEETIRKGDQKPWGSLGGVGII